MTDANFIRSLGWLKGDGPFNELVISSRLRLARNLIDLPFPYRASDKARKEILSKIREASQKISPPLSLQFIDIETVPPLERQALVETHLISPYLAQNPSGRGLLRNEDSTISVMINEEDHLRLQCFVSGLDLEKGWSLLNQLDDALESNLPYAFQEQWGYLSACPTNLGTGLRASTLLHLPALTFLQALPNLIHSLNQIGLTVRGFYGEGTESLGQFFQISNAFSLGPMEEDIVSRVSSIANQILEQELQARERLKNDQLTLVEDRVWRAFAILKAARSMNSFEAMEHLSMTRVGVQLEILPAVPIQLLNELILMTRPANLQKYLNLTVESDAARRDVLRAEYLRTALQNY